MLSVVAAVAILVAAAHRVVLRIERRELPALGAPGRPPAGTRERRASLAGDKLTYYL